MNNGQVPSLQFMEFMEAAISGTMRNVINTWKGCRPRYGIDAKTDEWRASIQGSCAEKLVAKRLGLYYQGALDNPGPPGDCGEYGVRSCYYDGGSLILHPEDDDDRVYILVAGRPPFQRIIGWITGREGKQDIHWKEETGRPAYFVPQESLYPMSSLPTK